MVEMSQDNRCESLQGPRHPACWPVARRPRAAAGCHFGDQRLFATWV